MQVTHKEIFISMSNNQKSIWSQQPLITLITSYMKRPADKININQINGDNTSYNV